MKLILASTNADKLIEYKKELNSEKYSVYLPEKLIDVEETGETLLENARLKGMVNFKKYNKPVIADDTGLFVEGLDGKPGIHSARFSKEGTYEANVAKLLSLLDGKKNRKAYFKTVIYLKLDESHDYFFSGQCYGKILESRRVQGGFGYDPVFLPDGYIKSFSELNIDEKNKISHRGKAMERLKAFLENF